MIIIYGGSFNPVTRGHIELSRELSKQKDIEKVIICPVGDLYNKKGLINFKHRYNMLKFFEEDKIEINDIQNKVNKVSLTYELMNLIKKEYPNKELVFLIGADNLIGMSTTWIKMDLFFKNYKTLVIERDGYNINEIINKYDILKKNKDKIIISKIKPPQTAATDIRNRLKINRSDKCLDLTYEEIYNYIIENNLYE